MKRHYHLILLSLLAIILFCIASCEHANQEYLKEECAGLYRISNIRLLHDTQSITITPELAYNKSTDTEGRAFYRDLDTALVFDGWINKRGVYDERMEANWSLIDWRLSTIDVKTLEAFDATHPAGVSLKDVLEIGFFYKRSFLTIPMDGFQYGSLMLTDYYPNKGKDVPENGIFIRLYDGDTRILPSCEITIDNYFGESFTIKTD